MEPPKQGQALARRKLTLYKRISLLQQILGLTWVQILYNEPSMILSRTWDEWAVLIAISSAIVYLGVCITEKAALSDVRTFDLDAPFVPGLEPKPPKDPK